MKKTGYKNKAEDKCYKGLIQSGWQVTKQGYPDFACFKGNELIFVEVKPKATSRLKRSQRKMMGMLTRNGIECFTWTSSGGFNKFNKLDVYP